MTLEDARKIKNDFDATQNPSDEEIQLYINAMKYLIEEEKSPRDMLDFGGYFYGQKNFELALEYYEMAADMDYEDAYECLGYIWYYGRTGVKDYEKAFMYFKKMMDKGNPVATYKVADMYKNGYFVEKNQAKYEEIIEELYHNVKNYRDPFDPVPEICTRLAGIKKESGEIDEAISLYYRAKNWLAKRISYSSFFGNINIMKWLINDLYEIMEFDDNYFDFFDLYYVLKQPHKVSFAYGSEEYIVESVIDYDQCVICFNGKCYHDRDEFFKTATIGELLATSLNQKFYDFELLE